MSALKEIVNVRYDYEAYQASCKTSEIKKVPKFCSPTYGKHPNPRAVETLKKVCGLVHRVGDYGVGYYADNVE